MAEEESDESYVPIANGQTCCCCSTRFQLVTSQEVCAGSMLHASVSAFFWDPNLRLQWPRATWRWKPPNRMVVGYEHFFSFHLIYVTLFAFLNLFSPEKMFTLHQQRSHLATVPVRTTMTRQCLRQRAGRATGAPQSLGRLPAKWLVVCQGHRSHNEARQVGQLVQRILGSITALESRIEKLGSPSQALGPPNCRNAGNEVQDLRWQLGSQVLH